MQIYNPVIRIYRAGWLVRKIFRREYGVLLRAGVPWETNSIRGASEKVLVSAYCETLEEATSKAKEFSGRVSGLCREVPVIHDYPKELAHA